MQQQQRHRFADDVAPADDDRVLPGERDPLALEQLDAAERRARHERRPFLDQPADIFRMKPVDVLCGIDGVEHALLRTRPHRRGQRRLHEDRVDAIVRIERAHRREHFLERCAVLRRRTNSARQPASDTALSLLRTYISDSGSLPCQHDAEAGRPPGRAVEAATRGTSSRGSARYGDAVQSVARSFCERQRR